ncbi:MAG TPA: alkaline phosphatase family protein [Chthoniobacteraceae bacterium]|nr:alkaline phosphatase family protein [Chthoniobacteraceae bacterium]
MKVCIIGLDCLEPSLVDRWLADLPTFARLRGGGAWGRMRSCVPPITVPAWSCMTSSRDPGALGIYGFRNRTSYNYDGLGFATSDWVKEPRLWDLLSAQGRKCAVLGVPGTYPPKPLNGQMIADFMTPSIDSAWAWPPALKDDVRAWLGGADYMFDVPNFRSDDKPRILADIAEMTRRRFTVAREMLRRHAPDFFMMVEMGSDRIHHGFWHYVDAAHRKHEPGHALTNAIHDYYVQLDGEIARLLELVDLRDTIVVLVSDHGAKRLDGGICVNDWLRREGWLVLKSDPPAPRTPLQKCAVDWSRTRAWAEGGYYARIFLNVKGREPQGIVDPREYERTRGELGHLLAAIPDDRGQPIETACLRPQQLYRKVEGIAPDLITIFGDLHWRAVGTLGFDTIYTFENDTGPDEANHAQYGFFNWVAPGVAPAVGPLDLDILDLAPTLLHQLAMPIPTTMQGNVATFGAAPAEGV